MISFANPQYLYLLLVVPIIVVLYFMARISRRKKLSCFGNISVIRSLMPEASRYTGWIKLSIELVALSLIIIAIARPIAPSKIEATEQESTQGIEVMICLDVSNSMLASSTDDPNGVSRLQRAKFILEKMIDKMDNDKVGLIVFAGDSYTQLPITSDYISAKMFLNDLSTDMVPTQGTAIGAAIDMAVTSFTPDSDCDKAIIIITDGENFEDDPVAEAARAASAGIQVDVIGIGSGNGAPIPLKGAKGKYMTDPNGAPVITKLDQETANEIAKAGKGIYLSGASPSVVTDLNDQLSKLKKSEYQRLTSSPAAELFPVFAIIALLLLMIDTLIPYRKISWLRGINFFSRSAKIITLIAVSSTAATAYAADDNNDAAASNRYERNYIADGNKLYKEKRFAEAEVMYKKALEANPGSETALFNLAAAYIRQSGSADPNAGNNPLGQAQEMLTKLAKQATDQSIAELSYYNLGNLAFNQENYQQSIEQYKNALRRNPDNDKARENLRLAQLRLQDQQNDDKNKDQNKDEENQNQDQQQQQQQNQNQNNNNDDQNKDQDQQQQQQQKDKQQPQKQNQGMSDANADQILKAMENEEAATRRRVEAERRKGQEVKRKKVTNPW